MNNNIFGARTFLLQSAMLAFSYVVSGDDANLSVALPSAAAVKGGRGIVLQDGVAGQEQNIVMAGNVPFRKVTGTAILKDDALTIGDTTGALRPAAEGEPVVMVAHVPSAAADVLGFGALIPGGGVVAAPVLGARGIPTPPAAATSKK